MLAWLNLSQTGHVVEKLKRSQVWVGAEVLWQVPEPLADLPAGGVDRQAVDRHFAVCWLHLRRQDLDQRCLAGTVWA